MCNLSNIRTKKLQKNTKITYRVELSDYFFSKNFMNENFVFLFSLQKNNIHSGSDKTWNSKTFVAFKHGNAYYLT